MAISPSGLRIFVMGNRGYASALLEELIANQEQIVGICCRVDEMSWSKKICSRYYHWIKKIGMGRLDDFLYQDPFEQFLYPEKIAHCFHIPVFNAREIKNKAFEQQLRALKPDVIFVAGFHRLIPSHVITIPHKAIVNFHPALLPQHRGGTPNRWVIRKGEKEAGVTAHIVNERFDEGDILLRQAITVGENETWGEVEIRIAALVPKVAKKVIDMIQHGELSPRHQREEDATYEPPYHGELQTINWSLPADEIRRVCNAIRPKSGGITTVQGKNICIWESKAVTTMPQASPGAITHIERGFIQVACGQGSLRIVSFLYRGKVRSASFLIKRYDMKVGLRFGS